MTFRFTEEHEGRWPVRLLCAALDVSPAGYHAWRDRPASDRQQRHDALLAEIRATHAEFQALTDVVNFYKTDPAKLMRLPKAPGRPFPYVLNVLIREMLAPEDYSRIRNSLFRVHYQFVMGNTRRYFYDFFSICCGPVRLRDRFPPQEGAQAKGGRPQGLERTT